jgi:hypothetical protein
MKMNRTVKSLLGMTMTGAIMLAATSCSKTNRYANRLEGEVWKVASISVGGEDLGTEYLPEWHMEDCDHHEELCYGHWEVGAEHADFIWQFDEEGQVFTISNQSDDDHSHDDHDHSGDDHDHSEDDHDHSDDDHDYDMLSDDAVDQCEEFSGTYDVVESKRLRMEFVSSATYGHPGEEVRIVIEKID